jgi:hypothetical protein
MQRERINLNFQIAHFIFPKLQFFQEELASELHVKVAPVFIVVLRHKT